MGRGLLLVNINDFPIIETERLILRQGTNGDASNLLKYLSNKDVVKHMGLEPFNSIDDALDEIS